MPEYTIAVTLYLICAIGRQKNHTASEIAYLGQPSRWKTVPEAKENLIYLHVNKYSKAQPLPSHVPTAPSAASDAELPGVQLSSTD